MDGIETAQREAEIAGRLVAHVLHYHNGDDDAKDTTIALLLEHLHYQRQCGIRESADLTRKLSSAVTGDRKLTLGIVAKALDALAAKNDATRSFF